MTYNVAVVGATGAVGREMLQTLYERKFPVGDVYALSLIHISEPTRQAEI